MKYNRKSRRNKDNEVVDLKDITPKNIKLKIFSAFVALLLLTSTVFIIYVVITMKDLLPIKYIITLFVLMFLILAIMFFFIFKKETSKKGRIATYTLSIICAILNMILSKYLINMSSFMKGIDTSFINLKTYYVIVLNNSNYGKIEDIVNTDIGYYHNELIDSTSALEKINSIITSNLLAYKNVDELGNALQENIIDAILIEESYKIMLEEEFEEFATITKVIYKFQLEETTESFSKSITSITTEPFVIYISGVDTYGDISSNSRSDANILVTINPNTNTVLLTSVPRDYYIKLHGTTGYKDKLAHAAIYGIDMSVRTLEDLLNVDINYYLKVNFTSLIEIIDALGGITVYSDQDFKTTYNNKAIYSYTEGENHLNGKQALAFSRERKAFASGDRKRGSHQQAVLQGIIKKATSYTIVSKFDNLLKALEGKFKTNMDYSMMQELVKYQLSAMPKWNVYTSNLDGYDTKQRAYSSGTTKLYVMVPIENSVRNARNLIQAVIKEQALDGSYKDEDNKILPSYITSIPKEVEPKSNEPKIENNNNNIIINKDENLSDTTNVDVSEPSININPYVE